MADGQYLSTDPNAGTAMPPPQAQTGHDFKILGVNIHVPGEDRPRADSNIVGWGTEGAGISPEDALVGGQIVRGVAKAAPGLAAKTGALLTQASPIIKYEATKTLLRSVGVPGPIAELAAMAASGMRRNGEPTAPGEGLPAPRDPNAPHLDRSVPVRPSDLTPQQMAERLVYGHGTPPDLKGAGRASGISGPVGEPVAAPPASTPAAPMSPSALGAALAPETPSAALSPSPKPRLTAAEMKEYSRLLAKGMTEEQAQQALGNMRRLAAMLGGASPEEVRAAVAHRNATGTW